MGSLGWDIMYMTGDLTRRDNLNIVTFEGRMMWRDTGRRWPSTSQEAGPSLKALGRNRPSQPLQLRCPASRTVRKISFCCLSHQSGVLCYSIPRKLLTLSLKTLWRSPSKRPSGFKRSVLSPNRLTLPTKMVSISKQMLTTGEKM